MAHPSYIYSSTMVRDPDLATENEQVSWVWHGGSDVCEVRFVPESYTINLRAIKHDKIKLIEVMCKCEYGSWTDCVEVNMEF